MLTLGGITALPTNPLPRAATKRGTFPLWTEGDLTLDLRQISGILLQPGAAAPHGILYLPGGPLVLPLDIALRVQRAWQLLQSS